MGALAELCGAERNKRACWLATALFSRTWYQILSWSNDTAVCVSCGALKDTFVVLVQESVALVHNVPCDPPYGLPQRMDDPNKELDSPVDYKNKL